MNIGEVACSSIKIFSTNACLLFISLLLPGLLLRNNGRMRKFLCLNWDFWDFWDRWEMHGRYFFELIPVQIIFSSWVLFWEDSLLRLL
jgi:hypothetical protein